MDVERITGQDGEALAKEVVNQPADIFARLKKLLGERTRTKMGIARPRPFLR